MATRSKNKSKSGKGKALAQRNMGPSVQTLKYRGPIAFPFNNDALYCFNQGNVVDLTSTAGGVQAAVISSDPTGIPNWADYAAIFDEFRVLGFKVKFQPKDKYDIGLTAHSVKQCVITDRNGSAALTSYAQATQSQGMKFEQTSVSWTAEARMSSSGEADFVNTSGGVANAYYIKTYADGLGASTVIGAVFVTYLIQFQSLNL